tara:strand:+ start:358 stop:1662 length:1305 start_codon:yes stop_codon:yes gene_type:complete
MKNDLFREFSKTDKKQIHKTFYWSTKDKIKINSIYNNPGKSYKSSSTDFSKNCWIIGQIFEDEKLESSILKAIEALKNGVSQLTFVIENDQEINPILNNRDLKNASILFYFKNYSNYSLNLNSSKNKKFLAFDILFNLVKKGNWIKSEQNDIALWKNNILENNQTVFIDARIYQNAGASLIEEIAFSINHVNEYLNILENSTKEKINFEIFLNIAIGSNYFFEIAKIQTLRVLLKRIFKEYKHDLNLNIVSEPSQRNMTFFDYNNNMMRTTSSCMAAILGGSNIINNLSYDKIFNPPNDFGDRISKNQLLILKHESHFDKIKNAIEGSFYIEKLIKKFSKASLKKLKKIEKKGGFIECVKNNLIQKTIKKSSSHEKFLFNKNKVTLVGINNYQDYNEKKEAFQKVKLKNKKTTVDQIITSRLAFETELKRSSHG